MNTEHHDATTTPATLERRRWVAVADLNWTAIFVLYSVLALIATGTIYTTFLAEGQRVPFVLPVIWEFTGYYLAFAFAPLIVLSFGLLPIRGSNWYWAVPAHLAISAVLGIVHTLLMRLTREHIYAWLDLGTYNYGDMSYRFLMEYHKQFVGYWAIYLALLGWKHYRENRERERQAAALELRTSELRRQLAQAQLEALRSQLNPHFLFNTLNMVSAVMYEDVNRADHMLAALSRMLRLSLEGPADARVPLRRELEFVRCGITLIEARFQDRVSIAVSCPPDALDFLVPNLILHTFIENAIKHHQAERDPVIRIQARVERKGDGIELQVLDNGPGIADPAKAFDKGVGVRNTRQRLRALYGERASLELTNRPEGGLRVRVGIPAEPTAAPGPI